MWAGVGGARCRPTALLAVRLELLTYRAASRRRKPRNPPGTTLGGRGPWNVLRRVRHLFYWLNSVNPAWLNFSHHSHSISPPTFPPVLLYNSFACHSSSCWYIYLLAFSLVDGIARFRSFLIFHVAHPPPVTTTNFIMLTSQPKQAILVFICAHSHCPGTSVVKSKILTAWALLLSFCFLMPLSTSLQKVGHTLTREKYEAAVYWLAYPAAPRVSRKLVAEELFSTSNICFQKASKGRPSQLDSRLHLPASLAC